MLDRKLRVGVTLFVRSGSQSIWENGIFQNCFFLVMLLKMSPAVASVVLVNGGDGSPEAASSFLSQAPAPIIDKVAAQQLDVVIELSAQLDSEWVAEFRARGGKVVGMRVANDFVIDVERAVFNLASGMVISGAHYDMIWTLPSFEKTCAQYYSTTLRAPVLVMPHLWSPVLVERSIAELNSSHSFGYIPHRNRWRIAILEPNVCAVKTSHIPMLVCDVAHRSQPQMIEYVRVYNALGMKERDLFVRFARSLDLVQHGIATFEARYATFEIMMTEADAVVSHAWENGQNYLYYEVLYGGYPLIHNSKYLGGCGYFFRDFDCEDGALALRQARMGHDSDLDYYRRSARAFLATLHPESESNVGHFTAALSGMYL